MNPRRKGLLSPRTVLEGPLRKSCSSRSSLSDYHGITKDIYGFTSIPSMANHQTDLSYGNDRGRMVLVIGTVFGIAISVLGLIMNLGATCLANLSRQAPPSCFLSLWGGRVNQFFLWSMMAAGVVVVIVFVGGYLFAGRNRKATRMSGAKNLAPRKKWFHRKRQSA